MLDKLEMHDIQDKTRLLDEMNETREAVNTLAEEVKILDHILKGVHGRLTELEGKVKTPKQPTNKKGK